jgi:putative oxidoreductase
MKIVVLVARLLLGLIFFVFGLNGLLHFLPQPPIPGDAGIWAGIMANHHWMTFIAVVQVIAGLLLLVNRFVPLALTFLGPMLVNILLFHLLLAGGNGILPGAICTVLELFLIVVYRRNFLPLLSMNPEADMSKL